MQLPMTRICYHPSAPGSTAASGGCCTAISRASTELVSIAARGRAPPPARAPPRRRPGARLAALRAHAADLFPLGYHFALVLLLAAAGLAPWRIAVVALSGATVQASAAARRRKAEVRVCVNVAWDRIAGTIVLAQTPYLVATGLAVAVTGGVRSPLLATFLAAWIAGRGPAPAAPARCPWRGGASVDPAGAPPRGAAPPRRRGA